MGSGRKLQSSRKFRVFSSVHGLWTTSRQLPSSYPVMEFELEESLQSITAHLTETV